MLTSSKDIGKSLQTSVLHFTPVISFNQPAYSHWKYFSRLLYNCNTGLTKLWLLRFGNVKMLATNIIFSSKGRSLPNENLNMED